MVNAVTAAAAVSDSSRPSACAAPYTTTDSRSQLGTVSAKARNTSRDGSSRSASRAPAQARSTTSTRVRGAAPERTQSSAAAARPSSSAGTASTTGLSPPAVVSGNSAVAMASSAATSSRRATTVETVAPAIGTPARTARAGRSTSPALTGSAWLAKSAPCRIATSRPTPASEPARPRSVRQANARSTNAAAYAPSIVASKPGLRSSSATPLRSSAPSAARTIRTALTATSTAAATQRSRRCLANASGDAEASAGACAGGLSEHVGAAFGSGVSDPRAGVVRQHGRYRRVKRLRDARGAASRS